MILFNEVQVVLPFEFISSKYKKWLNSVIQEEGKVEGEIVYVFCSDEYLHNINLQFLDHDTLTDIITFQKTINEKIISGEIFISIERVIENANKYSVDCVVELERVLVHGVLHLVGYKDKTPKQANEMRERENYYLGKQ